MHGALKFKPYCDSQFKLDIWRERTPPGMSVSFHFVTEGEGTELRCSVTSASGADEHHIIQRTVEQGNHWVIMDSLWLPGSTWSSSPGPEQTKLHRKFLRWVVNLSKNRDLEISLTFLFDYTYGETLFFLVTNGNFLCYNLWLLTSILRLCTSQESLTPFSL